VAWPPNVYPTSYQRQAMVDVSEFRRVCYRGPHGIGKTALAAWLLLSFAATFEAAGEDWKVVTTASAWRQLTHYLWPEIRKWSRRIKWDLLGVAEMSGRKAGLLQQMLRGLHGEAFPVACTDPSTIEGAHADHLLYIFDEAKAIPAAVFDAAEGALSAGDSYAVALSTPGPMSGRFWEICNRQAGTEDWHAVHVTKEQAIAAGRMDEKWADDRRRQWGVESAVYQNRVEGNFAASDEDALIPLAWIEAANERWHTWKQEGCAAGGRFICVGADVARTGVDQTKYAERYERGVWGIARRAKQSTMRTVGELSAIVGTKGGYAVVDVIGVGAGVVDRLRETGVEVVAFNASASTELRDSTELLQFRNARTAAWWAVREALDPEGPSPIALPPDDELTGDLTAPTWLRNSSGRIELESKDRLRKRIGRSPDAGDAVALALWPEGTNEVELW